MHYQPTTGMMMLIVLVAAERRTPFCRIVMISICQIPHNLTTGNGERNFMHGFGYSQFTDAGGVVQWVFFIFESCSWSKFSISVEWTRLSWIWLSHVTLKTAGWRHKTVASGGRYHETFRDGPDISGWSWDELYNGLSYVAGYLSSRDISAAAAAAVERLLLLLIRLQQH
jgi:hypothetical protein